MQRKLSKTHGNEWKGSVRQAGLLAMAKDTHMYSIVQWSFVQPSSSLTAQVRSSPLKSAQVRSSPLLFLFLFLFLFWSWWWWWWWWWWLLLLLLLLQFFLSLVVVENRQISGVFFFSRKVRCFLCLGNPKPPYLRCFYIWVGKITIFNVCVWPVPRKNTGI